ncbi:SRPBCC family protein [Pseudonocardia lacus]|uniref:SRPBCC family protein n=1 Tax=Pseudonocardia lacus TaxID=2835865 RepID=UPI001BDC3DBC|nr:SRPBCC domain-containing protein [Pseudonocardia lacus]
MSRPFEIRREVAFPVPIEQVWRAIATPEGQAGWFMPGPEGGAGVAAETDPPNRFAVRFGTQAMEYLLEAADGSTTVLRFVHSGIVEEEWGDEFDAMTSAGWHLYLHTLGQYLHHFPDRPAVYAEAEAPAAPDAWERVRAAIGDPAEGDRVHVAGLTGTVDIRTAHHVGLRTASALVRFHDRSPIGLPPAIGHHDYTPGADPMALTAGWTAWLAATQRS